MRRVPIERLSAFLAVKTLLFGIILQLKNALCSVVILFLQPILTGMLVMTAVDIPALDERKVVLEI